MPAAQKLTALLADPVQAPGSGAADYILYTYIYMHVYVVFDIVYMFIVL